MALISQGQAKGPKPQLVTADCKVTRTAADLHVGRSGTLPARRGLPTVATAMDSFSQRQELLGSHDGLDYQAKVYLNGQEVYKYTRPRGFIALDRVGPVTLPKGTNVLVFKVVNEGGNWEGCVRFVDPEGNPAEGLRVRLTPEP
jgi:hypothetical protein